MLQIAEVRNKVAILEAMYRGERLTQQATEPAATVWDAMSTEAKERIAKSINGEEGTPEYGYAYGRNITLSMIGYEKSLTEISDYTQNNRLSTLTKWAYLFAADRMSRNDGNGEMYGCISVDLSQLKVVINLDGYVTGNRVTEKPIDEHPATRILDMMHKVEITKDDILKARDRYQTQLRVWEREATTEKGQGFQKLLEQKPIVHAATIIEQFDKLAPTIKNNLVARTWGFEIEIPDAKDVKAPAGVEKGDDGSLRSYEGNDDCDCDCGDCEYHDCDCGYCDNQNTDPDHCGNSNCAQCDSAEYRTIGGVQRMQHAGMFKLCKELHEAKAELNDSAGTHIHVYAQDLTTHQVGQVLATYSWLDTILRPIAGRKNVNYAMEIPTRNISAALRKNDPRLSLDKPREINCMHLFNGRGTLEFRQMDCNANAERITAWAWLVRGFVTAAKRGAKISDYKHCKDLNDVIGVLAKFDIYTDNENPEQVVYGSKNDADLIAPFLKQHTRIDA